MTPEDVRPEDGGRTWGEPRGVVSDEHGGNVMSAITFVGDRVFLTYMHFPLFTSWMRFEGEPGYTDLRLVALPVSWFYRGLG